MMNSSFSSVPDHSVPRVRRVSVFACWTMLLALVFLGLAVPKPALSESSTYDIPFYGGPWGVLHRDNRNSDSAPYVLADRYVPHHTVRFERQQIGFNKPTVGVGNSALLTGLIPLTGPLQLPYMFATVPDSPQFRQFLTQPDIDPGISASSALNRYDGSVYLSDRRFMRRYGPGGQLLWQTPLRGHPMSNAHFTPEGDVFFFSWNGWFYVIDAEDGEILVEQNMTPGQEPPRQAGEACLFGDSGDCAFANAASIDPFSRRIYQMLYLPGDGGARMVAYHYPSRGAALTNAWEGDKLAGGSASSIVISADYQRLYVVDREGHLITYDSSTGKEIWRIHYGFVSNASPVVSDGGYIMPAPTREEPDSHFVIIKDEGESGRIVYASRHYTPYANAAAARFDRFATFGRNRLTGQLELLILDPRTGTMSRSPWGTDGEFQWGLLGVAIDNRGWIYVSGLGRVALRVYRPEDVGASTP